MVLSIIAFIVVNLSICFGFDFINDIGSVGGSNPCSTVDHADYCTFGTSFTGLWNDRNRVLESRLDRRATAQAGRNSAFGASTGFPAPPLLLSQFPPLFKQHSLSTVQVNPAEFDSFRLRRLALTVHRKQDKTGVACFGQPASGGMGECIDEYVGWCTNCDQDNGPAVVVSASNMKKQGAWSDSLETVEYCLSGSECGQGNLATISLESLLDPTLGVALVVGPQVDNCCAELAHVAVRMSWSLDLTLSNVLYSDNVITVLGSDFYDGNGAQLKLEIGSQIRLGADELLLVTRTSVQVSDSVLTRAGVCGSQLIRASLDDGKSWSNAISGNLGTCSPTPMIVVQPVPPPPAPQPPPPPNPVTPGQSDNAVTSSPTTPPAPPQDTTTTTTTTTTEVAADENESWVPSPAPTPIPVLLVGGGPPGSTDGSSVLLLVGLVAGVLVLVLVAGLLGVCMVCRRRRSRFHGRVTEPPMTSTVQSVYSLPSSSGTGSGSMSQQQSSTLSPLPGSRSRSNSRSSSGRQRSRRMSYKQPSSQQQQGNQGNYALLSSVVAPPLPSNYDIIDQRTSSGDFVLGRSSATKKTDPVIYETLAPNRPEQPATVNYASLAADNPNLLKNTDGISMDTQLLTLSNISGHSSSLSGPQHNHRRRSSRRQSRKL